jgi:hypothetical protein
MMGLGTPTCARVPLGASTRRPRAWGPPVPAGWLCVCRWVYQRGRIALLRRRAGIYCRGVACACGGGRCRAARTCSKKSHLLLMSCCCCCCFVVATVRLQCLDKRRGPSRMLSSTVRVVRCKPAASVYTQKLNIEKRSELRGGAQAKLPPLCCCGPAGQKT